MGDCNIRIHCSARNGDHNGGGVGGETQGNQGNTPVELNFSRELLLFYSQKYLKKLKHTTGEIAYGLCAYKNSVSTVNPLNLIYVPWCKKGIMFAANSQWVQEKNGGTGRKS